MATGDDNKTGKKATDEKILEVKKEEDENSDMIPKDEDDVPEGQDDKSGKINRYKKEVRIKSL